MKPKGMKTVLEVRGEDSMEILEKWKKIRPSKNAEEILKRRYYLKDKDGTYIENSWEEVSKRVARTIASVEVLYGKSLDEIQKLEKEFYDLVNSRVFIPNSPCLFNSGTGIEHTLFEKEILTLEEYKKIASNKDSMHQLSACFVVDVEDNMEGIMETSKEIALITKSGGGIGLNISKLRPKGAFVHGTSGESSGPISFLKLFNSVLKTIEQGYKRRGAGMAIMDITHPDIEEFIECKKDNDGTSVINMFNISIGVKDSKELTNKYENNEYIELTHEHSEVRKKIKAKDFIKKIAANAWKSGDPGLIMLDKVNKTNPLKNKIPIRATNPCGEQPLWPYSACNLGSIDLSKFYDEKRDDLDWESLEKVIRLTTVFLDNVIDANRFPLEKIEKNVKNLRPIGLGFMGFANLLYKLKVRYGSDESLKIVEKVSAYLEYYSSLQSYELSKIKGSFPLFDESEYRKGFLPIIGKDYFDWEELKEKIKNGKRNITTTTVAPTGSISNIADTSSGIEPNFMLAYTRYINDKDTRIPLKYVNPVFLKEVEVDDKLFEFIEKNGSIGNSDLPKEIKHVFVVSHDVKPHEHIQIQQAAQRYISSAISKTINLPKSTSISDIENIYLTALKSDSIKGITVYRDGSLETQVLESSKDKKEDELVQLFIIDNNKKLHPKPRRDTLPSVTKKLRTDRGTVYITVSFDDFGDPAEVFISDGNDKSEIIGRLSSMALRAGLSIDEVLEQLEKVSSGDFSHMVAKSIKEIDKFYKEKNNIATKNNIEKFIKENNLIWDSKGYYIDNAGNTYCPNCLAKNSLVLSSGCSECVRCGWSKCS